MKEVDLKTYFKAEYNYGAAVKYLSDREDLFWKGINLIYMVCEKISNDKSPLDMARRILCSKFINQTVASYTLLQLCLEDEFMIMYRQNLEVSWLLKYFIESDEKVILDWLSGTTNEGYVKPVKRRAKLDGNDNSDKLYTFLSGFTHTKSSVIGTGALGGLFMAEFIDKYFLELLLLIIKMLDYLFEIIEKKLNLNIESFEQSYTESKEHTYDESILYDSREKYHDLNSEMVILAYQINSEGVSQVLKQNGDIKFLEYLEENYE